LGGLMDQNPDIDGEADMQRIDGIINSMTPAEKLNPDRIDRSRRNRIARGSGVEPAEVGSLLKQFDSMSGMMKSMAGKGVRERMKAVKELADGGMMDPSGQMRKEKQRSKRGPQDMDALREQRKKKRDAAKQARKKNRKRK
ncbi:MAG: signal recognition particle protein, partial [Planctomycetaceae bacterium]|nr:signal recognition particle protein [Planctomycetaceae bacterium]